MLGAGAALAVHRAPRPGEGRAPAARAEALERALLELRLGEAEDSVRLLRGLEAHLAERCAGP